MRKKSQLDAAVGEIITAEHIFYFDVSVGDHSIELKHERRQIDSAEEILGPSTKTEIDKYFKWERKSYSPDEPF